MRHNLDLHICDITGDIYLNSSKTVPIEVYTIGKESPETNETNTVLSVSEKLLPNFENSPSFFVSESNELLLVKDGLKDIKPEELDDIILENVKEVITKINNDSLDIFSEENIESMTINNKKVFVK